MAAAARPWIDGGDGGIEVLIVVAGVPKPQGSKAAAIRGKRAVVIEGGSPESQKAFHKWRNDVRVAARLAMRELDLAPFDDAVDVSCTFVMPRPAKPTYSTPRTKPDVDKLARAVLDSISSPPAPASETAKKRAAKVMHERGPVLVDDALVLDLHAVKVYAAAGDPSGAVIRVRASRFTRPAAAPARLFWGE